MPLKWATGDNPLATTRVSPLSALAVRPEPSPSAQAISFDRLLVAISSHLRWRILRELLKEPLPSGVLAKRLGENTPNITKHMHWLCNSGLVTRGHRDVYHLRRELLTEGGTTLDAGFVTLRLDRLPE